MTKCQWRYPNKGGCGKTATFQIRRASKLVSTCHCHLPPMVKLMTEGNIAVGVLPIRKVK